MANEHAEEHINMIVTREGALAALRSNNTKTSVPSLGEVELRYVSAADVDAFATLLEEDLSDRTVVARFLHHQLVSPLIDFEALIRLPDEEIQQLARAFLANETNYEKSFVDAGDFFEGFRKAVNAEHLRQQETLRRIVDSFASVHRSIAPLTDSYTSWIQGITQNANHLQQTIQNLALPAIQPVIFDLGISESMRAFMESAESSSRMFSSAVQTLVDSSNRWVEQIKSISDPFLGVWEALQRQYGVSAQEAVKVLRKHNWLITPSLPTHFVYEVIEIGAQPKSRTKAINELFISYFEAGNWRNLERLVAGWRTNPLLGKRQRILRDCVRTLKVCKGDTYSVNAVLPTVVIQIDSALLDFMDQKAISGRSYSARISQVKKIRPKVLQIDLDEVAADIFLGVLFRESYRGDGVKTPFNFNRHKIVHGETVHYGRKDNLVRSFLVLDLLAHWATADAVSN